MRARERERERERVCMQMDTYVQRQANQYGDLKAIVVHGSIRLRQVRHVGVLS